VFLVAKARRQR